MAILTPLLIEDARRLGAAYGLDVVAARPMIAGSVNSNVELSLADGDRAFLRIYEEQTAESARGEAALLDHLSARGVKTPRPIAFASDAGSFIAEHAGKPVAVFPWVPGESLCHAQVSPEIARRVGAALARVHLAGASFEGAPESRFGARQLAARLDRARAMDLAPDVRADVDRLAARIDALAPRAIPARGVAHGDLFRDNVLWQDGAITALLDFEVASREPAPFDLMVTILAWCFGGELDRALSRALATGYAEVRPMPEAEAASLYDEGSFAAIRFAVTRITDFELRPRGASVYRDYRRFLARARVLDDLGSRGVRTFLGW